MPGGINYLTPLLLALKNEDITLFNKMLKCCNQLNERNINHINYALTFARNLPEDTSLVDILKKLNGRGSSLTACTDGQYCLHLAIQADDPKSVDWLVLAGANYNQENRDGIIPKELARESQCDQEYKKIFSHIAAEQITRELSTEICTTDGISEIYDGYIGTLERLSEFLAYFKAISGANENISLIENFGKKENLKKCKEKSKSGARGNAKGALFELEAAYSLILDGKKIEHFRVKYDNTEFDIETTSGELIECKSIYWPRHEFQDDTNLKKQLTRQQQVAKTHKKRLLFYSRNAIPEPWKDWMKQNDITFEDGIAAPSKAETQPYATVANRRSTRVPHVGSDPSYVSSSSSSSSSAKK